MSHLKEMLANVRVQDAVINGAGKRALSPVECRVIDDLSAINAKQDVRVRALLRVAGNPYSSVRPNA